MFIFILEIRYTSRGSLVMDHNRDALLLPSNCCIIFCLAKLSYFLLGKLLSRSNTEKRDTIGENREDSIMKNMFSKKRKIEVADCEVEVIPLKLETRPRSAESEECPSKFNNNPKESVT